MREFTVIIRNKRDKVAVYQQTIEVKDHHSAIFDTKLKAQMHGIRFDSKKHQIGWNSRGEPIDSNVLDSLIDDFVVSIIEKFELDTDCKHDQQRLEAIFDAILEDGADALRTVFNRFSS